MRRKIIAIFKAAFRGLRASAEKSARVQAEIDAAKAEFYRKHPEAFIRRGIL